MLVDRGCRLTIVPAQTSAEDVLKMNPDGIFLSNGPGDPAPCDYAITAIQKFLETDIPVFGICLGHQLLALASGAKTVKMKFGHHGGNHPVKMWRKRGNDHRPEPRFCGGRSNITCKPACHA
ncbi:glutamine amidotransferase-related protein [Escherichia coli]